MRERQDPHLNMNFKCTHCEGELKICWTCNGNGHYFGVDRETGRQRYDCKPCNKTGLIHSKQQKEMKG